MASWSTNTPLRDLGTSGAIFGSLAKYVLEQGGIVYGSTLDNNKVYHRSISSVNEIHLLQGSKYAQSSTLGIYREIDNYLKDGKKVLFSGLGCQVAGLLKYLGKRGETDNLITIDLICGGVPSQFLIDRYLQHNPDVKKIKSYRTKGRYEFTVIRQNGKEEVVPLNERPLPLCGFYTELTNRYSCYDCRFAFAHRNSDVTIGDLWGDTEYMEQHKNGLSVAIAHSDKGKIILEKSELEIHPIEWNNFLLHNPRMVYGVNSLGKSSARQHLAEAWDSYSYERILQEYANKASFSQPFLMAKKVLRYYRSKKKRGLMIKYVENLLKDSGL
jgi:coenzyme F420-reducing hydrogenase beta subunit